MKIHFCDLCNESVPQADLDTGRARVVKGRVICAACEAAMSHGVSGGLGGGVATAVAAPARAAVAAPAVQPAAPAAAGAAPRGSSGLAWVAGLALAFTALSIFVTDDRLVLLGRKQGELEAELAKKDDALRALQNDMHGVHPALSGVESRAAERTAAQAQRIDELAGALGALRSDAAGAAARVEALAREVERLRARVEEPGAGVELEKRLGDITARMARAEDERRVLADRIAELSAGVVAAKPAAAPAPAPEAAAPAWAKLLPDLKSPDESLRWEAVTSLGATKDAAVVPHLVPMLGDASVFVRMATARVLGEMGAKAAVPNLIDALEDSDSAMREMAWSALRAITGKDLKFEPAAPEGERQKRVKAWRDWWKKETGQGEG